MSHGNGSRIAYIEDCVCYCVTLSLHLVLLRFTLSCTPSTYSLQPTKYSKYFIHYTALGGMGCVLIQDIWYEVISTKGNLACSCVYCRCKGKAM